MRTPVELTAEFRNRGLKVTPQRQLLFRLLHGNTSHPTAERLFDEASTQMPGISLRTVYQTLTDLTRMGELQSFDFGASSTQFDPNVDVHHHLVCAACGAVVDVYVSGVDQLATTPALPDAEFSVSSTDIVFRGRCKNCRDDLTTPSHTATVHTSTSQRATRSQP